MEGRIGDVPGLVRKGLLFHGRVQGVGFRATARAIAHGHAVTGWVRNEPDGSVAMEVQGMPAVVEEFLMELRGRMGRLIKEESEIPLALLPEDRDFEIRR